MSETNYQGIDYGSIAGSNRNPETGIHYGVISQHSVMPECMDDVEYDYGKPHCPECGNEVKASDDETLFACQCAEDNGSQVLAHDERCPAYGIEAPETEPDWFIGLDYTCVACQKCYWSDSVFSDEAIGWTYQADGYKLTDCLDTDIFVLESPYYTYAQFCSPCVPGAGNLDSPMSDESGAKCYALGHDWFDGGKAPYRIWKVTDDSEVLAEEASNE